MSPPDTDDDPRAKLQRKALGNVRSLFETLDNKDKRDRSGERKFMIFAAIAVLAILSLLAIFAALRASQPGELEMARCVQDSRIDAVWNLRKELREKDPGMRQTEMDKLLERRFNDATPKAMADCARSLAKAP